MCYFPPEEPKIGIQNSKQLSHKEVQVLTDIFSTLLEFPLVYVKWLLILVLSEILYLDHPLLYHLDLKLTKLLWQARDYDRMGRVLGSQLWGLGFCLLEICLLEVFISSSINKRGSGQKDSYRTPSWDLL